MLAIFFKRQKYLCFLDYTSERSSKPKCFCFPFQLNHTLFGVEIWQETLLYYPYIVAGLISLSFFDRWMSSWALNIFSSADSKASFGSWFPWLWVLTFINFSPIYNSKFFLTMLRATSCLLAFLANDNNQISSLFHLLSIAGNKRSL